MDDPKLWQELGQQFRVDSVRCAAQANSGHPTSGMSAADMMAVLTAKYLRYDFGDPAAAANDRLVFSKGHASTLLYAIFRAAGAISEEELLTYRSFGSRLEGHPTPILPWVDVATGSLGQGLPIGVGMAICGKYLDRLPSRVWVLCDVYEADLGVVRVGDTAEVRLNAYPDRTLSGRVSDISRILDQTTRTAKVRIELDNAAGLLRPGAGEAAAAQVSSVAAWRTIRRLCRSTGIPPFPTFDRADAKAVHGSAPTGTRAPWQRENAGQGEQRCTRVS